MRVWRNCSWTAMNPAELSVSLAALEQVEARTQQIEQQWQLRIERAGYEADLARQTLFRCRSGQPTGGPQSGTRLEPEAC